MMKKWIILLALLAMASSCAKSQEASEKPVSIREETPIKLEYHRMWEYGAFGESEDAAYIEEVVDTLRQLKTGDETNMAAEDYTDVLVFTYADGSTEKYVIEAQWMVMGDGKRYEVIGNLSALRRLLDELVEE